MIYNLYKQRGETPLECIQRFRATHSEVKGDKFTYLGRLDPMAEGVLLVASGEDVSQTKREEFMNLDKDYDFIVLFGFSTDTYDILGRVLRVERLKEKDLDPVYINKVLKVYEGEREQKYPPYSSRTVEGRPLHEWSRKGEIDEIEIPTKKVTVHKINFHGLSKLSAKEMLGRLLMDVSKVQGDFRHHETMVLWKQMLVGLGSTNSSQINGGEVYLGKFSAHVSSGTYIRGIINDLGNTLGLGACALSIVRTRVGTYKIEDSVR